VLAHTRFIHSWLENVKIGTCNRGFVMNLAMGIDLSAYKKVGTKKYWINNKNRIFSKIKDFY
jgi:hypothetical protein